MLDVVALGLLESNKNFYGEERELVFPTLGINKFTADL